jgi:hypothetical protein
MCLACSEGGFDLEDGIDRAGHVVIAVVGDLVEEERFAYTVGLHGRMLPELVVFGQHPSVAGTLLNDLAEMLRSGEVPAVPGREIPGMLGMNGEFSVRLGAVHPRWSLRYAACAYSHYHRLEPGEIDLLQVVVPDLSGRFPDDPTHDEHLDQIQPDLSHPDHRWRTPLVPSTLWNAREVPDALALVPIIEQGHDAERREAVPVRLVGDSAGIICAPPILADWVTTGTIVGLEEEARPVHPDLPWGRNLVRTIRESPLFSAAWVLTPAVLDATARLEQAIAAIEAMDECSVTVTATSLHLAGPPRSSGRIRALMRRLERDGLVRERELHHIPQPGLPPTVWQD